MPGPAKKPTKLKAAQGNPGGKPLPKNEPVFGSAMPECPEHIDDYAKQVWYKLAPQLHRQGLLDDASAEGFTRYCSLAAIAVKAERDVKRFGITLETEKGTVKNPAVNVLKDASSEMRLLSREYGLYPGSRASIKAPSGDKKEEKPSNFLLRKQA